MQGAAAAATPRSTRAQRTLPFTTVSMTPGAHQTPMRRNLSPTPAGVTPVAKRPDDRAAVASVGPTQPMSHEDLTTMVHQMNMQLVAEKTVVDNLRLVVQSHAEDLDGARVRVESIDEELAVNRAMLATLENNITDGMMNERDQINHSLNTLDSGLQNAQAKMVIIENEFVATQSAFAAYTGQGSAAAASAQGGFQFGMEAKFQVMTDIVSAMRDEVKGKMVQYNSAVENMREEIVS